jgi:lysozyme
MLKRLTSLFFIVLFIQFSVFAKTSHRKHKSKHKVHHVEQPAVTLDEVNPDENVWGIDVSHHQNDINWQLLAEKRPDFMFIKASEGTTLQDSKYNENYTQARKLGIHVGSYHFFSYKATGKEQAKNFLSVAQQKDSDLLPVLDAEFIRRMPKKEKVTIELANFINTIYEKLGHYPIVYCDYRYYNLYLKEKLSDKCKLWIVNYKEKPSGDWAFWQMTNRLKLDGIRGCVDFNMFNGPISNLKDMLYRVN